MSGTLAFLVAFLVVWMLACAHCGYLMKFVRFLAVVLIGLVANAIWMGAALNAHPLELNALTAQGAAVLYALCAFGIGWLLGRIRRQWQATKVADDGV